MAMISQTKTMNSISRTSNFRLEGGGADRVLDHSRVVEGSVRKKTNSRKFQRKSKEEGMAQAEFERKEELKHLKNLKKKIQLKLEKIRAIVGIGDGGSQEGGDLENQISTGRMNCLAFRRDGMAVEKEDRDM